VVTPREEILERLKALLTEAAALGDASLLAEVAAVVRGSLGAVPASAATAHGEAVGDGDFHGIIGKSAAMETVYNRITKFATADAPVMITGESGTGKEMVARAIHELSRRRARPMVSENCAAIPETLLESVLFGHVRGAFTGAVRDHPGHFVSADGGTLFLDEIGDMPVSMQVKLLRALQEGEVRPVGGSRVRKVDVRVIAATNQDLEQRVRDGAFREDLFFRLNVLRIALPPLRQRGEDAVLLARRFLAAASARQGRPLRLGAQAEDLMRKASWPGNVRQLQNEIQRVAALCDGPEVGPGDFSRGLGGG
jgi:transcriptional regulator with GAF, ATPase, and Fis domain